MFTVIQNQQGLFVLQEICKDSLRRSVCLTVQAQRIDNNLRYKCGIGKWSKFYEPCAIRKILQLSGSSLNRKAGFANTANACEGNQPALRHEMNNFILFLLTTDEGCRS